jgi:hypothetical protein
MEVQLGIVEIKPGIDALPQQLLGLRSGLFPERVAARKLRGSYGVGLINQR